MAKIRAYKLAEELGIDRQEFVDRAKEHGIELKSAMVGIEDEQAALLREALGSPDKAAAGVVERRVEGKRGATVLRRRKKVVAPEPEPEPEVVPEPEPETAVEEPVAEPAAGEPEPFEPEVVEPEIEEPAPDADEEPIAAVVEEAEPIAARERVAVTPKPDTGQPAQDRKGRQRKRVREVVNLQEQEQFARQITGRPGGARRAPISQPRSIANPRRKRRDKLNVPAVPKPASEQSRVIKLQGDTSVGELAKLLGAKAPVVQGKLMAMGIMVSINQAVDVETCRKIAEEFSFEVEDVGFKEEAYLEPEIRGEEESTGSLSPRPPVITVMGHVDHGKTSLLDAIRKSKVVDDESGGITQHIGAYQVNTGKHTLTFIDTPGHAAFTAMRARGAAVTDIVVLVVAANDGVMPQTVEAIQHAQAAGCPIFVAINKIDLPDADADRTKQRLTEHNLVPEEFGGDVICANISAKTGEGIDEMLEMLALQAELLELRADPTRRAKGVVLEARLETGRGAVATVLVQDGTLSRGDTVVVGTETGRVRVMENDLGERVKEAGPSCPVQLIGLSGVPEAGAAFHVVENDRIARQIIAHREDGERSKPAAPAAKLTLEEFFAQAEGEGAKELSVVLKADVQGTCEVVRNALEELSTDEVKLKVLSSGVGAISESDIMLASASKAIVIGFHVRPDPAARRAAESNGVDVRTYSVIMQLLDDVSSAMAGLLPPTFKETLLGRAEVKQTFTIPRIGTIAGCVVIEGKILRNKHCRLVRDGVQVHQGKLGSLRRFKDDVAEVSNGTECGIGIENFNDIKVDDVIEVFEVEEVAATL